MSDLHKINLPFLEGEVVLLCRAQRDFEISLEECMPGVFASALFLRAEVRCVNFITVYFL